jgi:hypothetical protein
MTRESTKPAGDTDSLSRYTKQSWVTDPGSYAHLYRDLPDDLADLCRAVQGLLVHYRGSATIPADRLREIDTRRVEVMLARIMELDSRPLALPRPLKARLVGCCRDYAVLLCSILRCRGVPVRVRFGFATYFEPDFMPDHVVAEYWNRKDGRWVLVDAELSEETCRRKGINFDPRDLPRDRFLLAGNAWQLCRKGDLDPNRCGANAEICGLPFVGRYVSHDLAALDQTEVLCWDGWGMTDVPPGGSLAEEELALLDVVAAATIEGRTGGFNTDPRLRARGEIHSYSAAGFYTITIP